MPFGFLTRYSWVFRSDTFANHDNIFKLLTAFDFAASS